MCGMPCRYVCDLVVWAESFLCYKATLGCSMSVLADVVMIAICCTHTLSDSAHVQTSACKVLRCKFYVNFAA